MSKDKSFKLNVGFITGVFAVCAVSIATGYFLKNGSISADTTAITDLEYSNSEKVTTSMEKSVLGLYSSATAVQTCAKSTGTASAALTTLNEQEKEQYGEQAKAYTVKINGENAEFRLVMAASRVNDANDSTPNDGKLSDAMVEYTLSFLNDPRRPSLESWGGGVGSITLMNGANIFKKTYGTIIKNDPWQDFIKIKNGYTDFAKAGSSSFNIAIQFNGKNNDGCITKLDLKDSLIASAEPAPSVTPTASKTVTTTVAVASQTPTSAMTQQPACATKDSSGGCANITAIAKDVSNFRGCYYAGKNFDKYVGSRNDFINFSWGGGPATSKTGENNFSVRWAGDFKTFYSDEYTFTAVSDDGIRVWVDGKLIIDAWGLGGKTSTGKIDLVQGKFPIKVEYYEQIGTAKVNLTWKSKNTVKTPNALATVSHSSDYLCDGQTTVSPTPTVSTTPSVTPTVGYDYRGDERLNMSLKVDPIEGKLPLTVSATANVGGTATGKIHWRMYCGDKLPGLATAIVPPSKEVTDSSTTQTLSCTYENKKSYRVSFIAEREGLKVATRVWVKAGTVPTNDQSIAITLKKGFNTIGSELYTTSNRLTKAASDLTVFRFNYFSYPKWTRWPQQDVKFALYPGNGYYIYSPTDRTINVSMVDTGESLNKRRLFEGWNMVWVKGEHKGLKDVFARIAMNKKTDSLNIGDFYSNKCLIENQDLQELVDKGVAYKYVYVISDGNATDACNAFKLLETGSVAESCKKINASKSATTTSTCSACSLEIVDKLQPGDTFWIYLYESKIRKIKGLTGATVTPTPTATSSTTATADSISLSGKLCK